MGCDHLAGATSWITRQGVPYGGRAVVSALWSRLPCAWEERLRRDGDAHLKPASAGEQYHAEGLYKDRSAFYTAIAQRQSAGV